MKKFIALHVIFMLVSLLPVSKTCIPSVFAIHDNSFVKNSSCKNCYAPGSENPFRTSAIIPHWE